MQRVLHTTIAATSSRQLASQACTCGIRQSRRNLSTINQDEISHFASLAATWWDEAGDFNVLQRMNKVRVQFLRDRLSEEGMIDFQDPVHFLKGKKVLDVGCGGGLFTEVL
jgi:2-polyprenyl-6-hydroxyphenyl methylase/3-demethylubiquinone-9 3-methyltransferase